MKDSGNVSDTREWGTLKPREKFRFAVEYNAEPLELFEPQNMKMAFQKIDLVA